MNIITNQDLYRQVTANLKSRAGSERTLAQYLCRLLALVSIEPKDETLTLNGFAHIWDAAFDGEIALVDFSLLRSLANDVDERMWLRRLAGQIVDLHEMEIAGILDDKWRDFGLNSPSGGRWYNFEPHSYIECGLTGAFGGWQPSDDSDRIYVPGLVAALDSDGNMVSAKPEDIANQVLEMAVVSWDEFLEFIECGQCYE